MKIETKVEYWKNKLLDLGKRNKMINCPLPNSGKRVSRTTLTIEIPEIGELWDKIMKLENGIEFPIDLNAYVEGNEDDEERLANNVLFSNGYKTNQSVSDTCKTLIALKNKARVFMDNKGMNALYLAFGFLNWKENGTSGQQMRSPLILVPAVITQESIADSIFLAKTDEDPISNNSLQQKMYSDFNISIPEYDENDDLNSYFYKVENECKSLGWTVDRSSVQLMMLSYLKMAMYRDIEIHQEAIVSNSIIRTLNGETDQLGYDSIPEVGKINHDAEEPRTVYSVVDADSSQQDAITLAKSGVSFVLQGPPGTGKSQTITNIIAELLGQGKKVLFVSEKMAALDVVYRRLSAAGLADFCLTLHNPDAKRKEIMDQLAISVKLSESKATASKEAFQTLETLKLKRQTLNSYITQLHTKVEPLGETIFRVNGHISMLDNYPDIDYIHDNAANVTPYDLTKMIDALKDFARIIEKSGYQDKNPWLGSTMITGVNHAFRQKFLAQSAQLIKYLGDGVKLIADISKLIAGTDTIVNFKICCKYLSVLEVALKSPHVSYLWSTIDVDNAIKNTEMLYSDIQKKQEEEKVLAVLKEYGNILLGDSTKIFEAVIADNDDVCSSVTEIFNSDYSTFVSYLSPKEVDTVYYEKTNLIYDLQQCTYVLQQLRNTQNDKTNAEQTLEKLENEKNQGIKKLDTCRNDFNKAGNIVTIEYEEAILDLDITDLHRRFANDYNSFWRFLNSQYRKDRKQIREYSKNRKNISYKNAMALLGQIADAQYKRNLLEEQDNIVHSLYDQIDQYHAHILDLNESIKRLQNDLSANKRQFKEALDKFEAKIKQMINTKELLVEKLVKGISMSTSSLSKILFMPITEASNFTDIISKLRWVREFNEIIREIKATDQFREIAFESTPELTNVIEVYANDLSLWCDKFMNMMSAFTGLFDAEAKKQFDSSSIDELLMRIRNCRENIGQLETLIDYKNAVKTINDNGLDKYLDIVITSKTSYANIVPSFQKCFYRSWLDEVIPQFEQINSFRHDKQEMLIEEFKRLDLSHMQISQAILKRKLIEQLPNLNFSGNGDEAAILKRELNKRSRLMPIRKLIALTPGLLPALKPCMLMSPLSVSTYLGDSDYRFDTVIFDEASQLRTEESVLSIFRAKQVIIAGDSKQLPPTNFFSSAVSDADELYEDEDGINDAGAYESLLDEASILPAQTLLWHYRSKHEHLIAFSNYKIYQKSLITFPSAIEKAPDLGVEYVYVQDGIYERGGTGGNLKEAERICELLIEHFNSYPDRSIGIIAFGEKQQNVIENEIIHLRRDHPEFEQYFRDNRDEPIFIRNLESVQGDERDTIIFSIGYGYDANGKFLMNFGPLSRNGGERRLNVAVTRARYNLKLVGSILPTDIKTESVSSIGPKLLREYIDFAMNGEIVLKDETTTSDDALLDSPFEESVYEYLTSQGYRVATQVGCSGYRIDMAVYHPDYEGCFAIGIECDGAVYHSARTARERDRLRQAVLENMGWKIYRIWSTDWIKDTISEKKRLIDAIDRAFKDYCETSAVQLEANDFSVKKSSEYLKVTEKTDQEIENEQMIKYRSTYMGLKPQEISIADFESTLIKILESGYGRSRRDNLIRDAARYGYGWNRVGSNIRSQFESALKNLHQKGIIDMNDDQIKMI